MRTPPHKADTSAHKRPHNTSAAYQDTVLGRGNTAHMHDVVVCESVDVVAACQGVQLDSLSGYQSTQLCQCPGGLEQQFQSVPARPHVTRIPYRTAARSSIWFWPFSPVTTVFSSCGPARHLGLILQAQVREQLGSTKRCAPQHTATALPTHALVGGTCTLRCDGNTVCRARYRGSPCV